MRIKHYSHFLSPKFNSNSKFYPLPFRFAYSIFLEICSITRCSEMTFGAWTPWSLIMKHTKCIWMSYLLSIFAYAHCMQIACTLLGAQLHLCALWDMKEPNRTHSVVLSRVNYFSCTKQKTNKKLCSVCISVVWMASKYVNKLYWPSSQRTPHAHY